jgi:cytochrome c oxidase assembly protein subunit 11
MIKSLSPNAKTASFAALLALAMTGLGFAAVPL